MRYYINPDNKSYITTYCYKQINMWFAEYNYFKDGMWKTDHAVNDLHFKSEEDLIEFIGVFYKEVDFDTVNDYRRSVRMMDELIV